MVILTATGKGFCAGVDIKEMQKLPGNEGILGANDSCFELFRAIYECAVPVIAAMNDFCLGTGIGIAGNADIVSPPTTPRFGLPEIDNGALGAATHLKRLVPQHRARQMMYTCELAPAAELATIWHRLQGRAPRTSSSRTPTRSRHVIAAKDHGGAKGQTPFNNIDADPTKPHTGRTGLHFRTQPVRRRRQSARGILARRTGNGLKGCHLHELLVVVMAAGLGSRFGGNKQLVEVGPDGEVFFDFAIDDAVGGRRRRCRAHRAHASSRTDRA